MSRLEWDKTGEHFIETGVSNMVLYPQAADGTYPKGVAWNGITGVTENPDGAEPQEFWADNILYAKIRGRETYGNTITAFTYPDEWDECNGFRKPMKGLKYGQQERAAFGICYRTEIKNDTGTEEDDAYRLHIAYNLTASPSDMDYETVNDTPDAVEMSWDCESTPVPVTGYKHLSTVEIDSRDFATDDKKGKLEALINVLYGSEDAEARLPLPDELYSILNTTPTSTGD